MRTYLSAALTLMMFSLAAATTVQVKPGDTLTRIAVRHGTTVQALQRANPRVNADRLRVGTGLRLPAAAGRTWTVRQGDTLSLIALRSGTTLGALLGVNRGLNPRLPLRVGQRVTLPAPATARTGTTTVVRAASIRVNAALPVQGRVTTPYQATHPGLDLAAPTGTPIRAAFAGSVVESYFDRRSGWGWTVVLDHGSGLRTRYSHNSANLVRVGARVGAGDVIARVGSTGNSTGAHVDYRLYRRGQAVDPSSVP
ncbi:LysM peptidoglycan-binding domain-containing M23 family metallopeptidase [Deinococcus budaensis]|uniref:Murein DD-endopeptidase MepM/ murein hydrolase activator NlpD n=1 Tax=Deinococcus budaensis TaxID=1665626 RepID=A0A7W8LQ61_9DEIO|nr:M23 family metallopeptidase [Deinococcus budaensis]MBB5234307.1 murein DD-endopeptidase MepM/ murein hydrolase activator NlpD [Deinococcus budaensis]